MSLPTYHRAPHFSIPPPPQGPLHLGLPVRTLENLVPLSRPDELGVSASETYMASIDGFHQTTISITKGNWTLCANLIGLLVPGTNGSINGTQQEEEELSIKTVDTYYYVPTTESIQHTVRLPGVKAFLEATRYKKPFYIVTGLKVARGASANIVSIREKSRGVGVGGGPVAGPARSALQGNHTATTRTSFQGSSDFVLGFQVTKVQVKKLGGIGSKEYTKGAQFYGDDEEEEDVLDIEVCHNFGPSEAMGEGVVEVVEEIAGLEPSRWVL